jgi:hypothetical protein
VNGDHAELSGVKRTLRLLPACALGLLALAASACGSSGSSASSASSRPQRSPAALAKDQVTRMVLQDGDLPGYSVQSTGGEPLKDQLPPPKLPQAALAGRLVRANWLASEHSVLVSANHRSILISDVNLFRAAAPVSRLWGLELAKVPGTVTRFLTVPPGAPAGAKLSYQRQGAHAGFALAWRQGPVVALEVLPVSAKARISERRYAALLGRAAHAQALRIAAVASGARAS